ncbi:hypothetical protein ACG873_01695 (plasmid) [Mesorhizobium sp. AaZ16]|uniref:hypothetical protein n=1 Tax=Mesorhizobium sp. AaZ16 TaxID=3402289 RepID=UPI00374EE319
MKSQKRPFVVEIRQKRGAPKRPPSIWGDVDLAGAADAVRNEAAEGTACASPAGELSPVLVATPRKSVPAQPSDVGDANAQVALAAPELPETPANLQATPQTKADVAARRLPRRELLLPRGERWKRRLPEVLQLAEPWSVRRSVLPKRGRSGTVGL